MKTVFALLATAFGLYLIMLPRETFKLSKTRPLQHPIWSNGPNSIEGRAQYEFLRARNPYTSKVPDNIRKQELEFVNQRFGRGDRSSTVWKAVGPFECGGRTRALLIDATDEQTIWAGQVSGGLWKSTDGGLNFSGGAYVQGGAAEDFPSVSCIAQDTRPGKEGTLYVGTGEYYGLVSASSFSSIYSGNGIYKRSSAGGAFVPLASTQSNTPHTSYQKRDFDYVWKLVTDPSNLQEDEVYAAVVNGIWRSTDGGSTWQAVLGLDTAAAGLSDYTDIAITPSGVLYATVSDGSPSGGIYRSPDGITWTKITPAGFAPAYNRIKIGIAPSDPTKVYFLAETPGTGTTGHSLWFYQYLSGNGSGSGGTWVNRTANLPDDECKVFYTFDFRKYSSQSSYDMYVVVHPSSPDIVFLGGTNIYRSFDGFSTPAYEWIGGYQCDSLKPSNYVYPNHHPDQHELLFLPSNPQKAYSGSDGGVRYTHNILASPVIWESRNKGYNSGQFYTCAIGGPNGTTTHAVGGAQDNGTWFTGAFRGGKWKQVFYGDGAYCSISKDFENYYLSWQSGKTFKFNLSDTGAIEGLERIDPPGASGYSFINPFILDPTDDNRMYLCAGKRIFRNDSLERIPLTGNEYNTNSIGWTALNITSTGSGFSAPGICALSMSPANPHTLFYGTETGSVYRLDSCRNSNAQKKTLISAQFPSGAYVSCIAQHPDDHAQVVVTFSNYEVRSIFYSSDTGNTWTDISGNLEEFPDGTGNGPGVYWFFITKDQSGNRYYAGTSAGLFSTRTLQGGSTTWTHESDGIGRVPVNMITGVAGIDQPLIFVATHGRGMMTNDGSVGMDPVEASSKNTLHLYPNPARDRFNLHTEKPAKELRVYSLQGNLIQKLTLRGNSTTIPVENWNSGVYLLNVTFNDGQSKAIRLVKE